jgi:hypothetical protein
VSRKSPIVFLCAFAAVISIMAPDAHAEDALLAGNSHVKTKTRFQEKFFFEAGGGGYCFPGLLFSLDSSLTKYPEELCGFSATAAVGYRITSTFSLSLRAFKASGSGLGEWKETTGDPMQDAFNAGASGRSHVRNSGFAVLVRKEFPVWRLRPFIEGGGGIGTITVRFKGIATAIDPDSGSQFEVPASGGGGQRIPIAIFGTGLQYVFYKGMQIGPVYEWNTGYTRTNWPSILLTINPLETFSRHRS